VEVTTSLTRGDVQSLTREFLSTHGLLRADRAAFLAAQYDAGLAWVHFPVGLGGLGADRQLQQDVDTTLRAADAPSNSYREPDIGLGMAAPTIMTYADPPIASRFLRPLFAGTELWCQLFSEPGAGSDLAAVTTRAIPVSDGWIVTGQKVWTSNAHNADWGILLARTDPEAPKHRGLSFFICDMRSPGVTIRPLRLLTGDAEFNEVFLDEVFVPKGHLLGDQGEGWRVAQTTLGNERVAIGAGAESETSMLNLVLAQWAQPGSARSTDLRARIARLWVDALVYEWVGGRPSVSGPSGTPGPEGSGMKLAFARMSQSLSGIEVELAGDDGLDYDDWSMRLSQHADFTGRNPVYRYLRARGNSIEGGTSEILRNIIAERVLGLPREPRVSGRQVDR
jgi:alkylation response protein AidB-like acyl-CoA dehydrogenase